MKRTSLLLLATAFLVSACGGGDPGGGTVVDDGNELPADCNDVSGNDRMLCMHNKVRATATPRPEPALESLAWDKDLATVAQSWAENCTFEHNPDRASDYSKEGGSGSVGENIYAHSDSTSPPENAVTAWASEAADYNYDKNQCADGEVCGHYTQLVWRNTRRVGCGSMACGSIQGLGFGGLLVVCNYAPAGNVIGQRPY